MGFNGPLREFLALHGFRSLLTKLGRHALEAGEALAAPPPASEQPAFEHKAYETITTVERLDWWIAEAVKRGVVAVDTETTDLDAVRADLVGVSLALEPGLACYIPVGHVSGEGLLAERVDQLGRRIVLDRLNRVLIGPDGARVELPFLSLRLLESCHR